MIQKSLFAMAILATAFFTSAPALGETARRATLAPAIDGSANDEAWQAADWRALDKHILGDIPDAADFSGRYKVTWAPEAIYILAEITDDILFDQHADPRHLYWDDDSLEIFIDEDKSGGNHQFNYNAFAYHVALDGQAADIGPNTKDDALNVVLLNDHIKSAWKRSADAPNKVIWEVALSVYDDAFNQGANSKPVQLSLGKKLGFMLAYCDNDGSKTREHFMGSHEIEPVNGDKNLGYINASVFGELELIE